MRKYLVFLTSALALFWLATASTSLADVDWEVTKAFKLETKPLDIASSPDGKRVFVLAEDGNLLIYEEEGTLIDTVRVDPGMDKLSVSGEASSPLENKVFLSSKTQKTAQQIVLSFRADIDITGAPFLGAPDAPVSIVVFSDFQ